MAVNRQERVARLKRMIILTLLAAILLPTILCIYLIGKVHHLEKEIQDLYQTRVEIVEKEEKAALKEPEQKSGKIEKAEKTTPTDGMAEPVEEEDDSRRKVYLTFDDGPSCYTEEILTILDRYGVKATFFVVGKEEADLKPLYREIADRGHTI